MRAREMDTFPTTTGTGPLPMLPGTLLAPGYRIVQHLNRGAVLDVYSVHSEARDCLCIAKVPRADRHDPQEREQLRREGGWLLDLSHPHLVRGYDLLDAVHGPCDGGNGNADTPVLILETLTGATLSRLIEEHSRLPKDDLAVLGRQLVSVLHYLHSHRIIHLDLKPSNVVCQAGLAKVLDLSLAQHPGRCRPGAGTHEYMAPEQVTGDTVGPATDIWGLGGILYRAATGRRPFQRATGPRTATDMPDPEPLWASNAGPRLGGAIASCLASDPARRPSITELRSIFDATIPDPSSDQTN